MYINIYKYIYIHICIIYIYIYIHIYIQHMHTHIYIYICIYIYMRIAFYSLCTVFSRHDPPRDASRKPPFSFQGPSRTAGFLVFLHHCHSFSPALIRKV